MFLTQPIGRWLEDNKSRFSCPPACKKLKNCYGIEIEMEGRHSFANSDHLSDNFSTTRDPSMKVEGSREYCLKVPRNFEDFIQAVNGFYDNLQRPFAPSYRAATHIHMNMYKCTMMELANISFKYYAIEEILALNHKDRFDNPFSLKLSNAKFPMIVLMQSFAQQSLQPLCTDDIRYGSLNFKALMDHASLEFRAFETTDDKMKLIERITILNALTNNTCSSPKDLFNKFNTLDADEFLETIYGSFVRKHASKIPGYETALVEAFRTLKIWINTYEWKVE